MDAKPARLLSMELFRQEYRVATPFPPEWTRILHWQVDLTKIFGKHILCLLRSVFLSLLLPWLRTMQIFSFTFIVRSIKFVNMGCSSNLSACRLKHRGKCSACGLPPTPFQPVTSSSLLLKIPTSWVPVLLLLFSNQDICIHIHRWSGQTFTPLLSLTNHLELSYHRVYVSRFQIRDMDIPKLIIVHSLYFF